jgi:hypothetical protein
MAREAIDRSFQRQKARRNDMSARSGNKHFGAMQQQGPLPKVSHLNCDSLLTLHGAVSSEACSLEF